MAEAVKLSRISKHYKRKGGAVEVLREVTVELREGEFLAIMGPSGSGKTTLLNIVGDIDRPTEGEVWVCEYPLHRCSDAALAQWRAGHVGLVFQFYHLIPVISARANVELALDALGIGWREREKKSAAALTLSGLPERFWSFKPSELSGGQQQRVGIARAIVSDPVLLICDEPTGDLDLEASEEILSLLVELTNGHRKTVIMATHDGRAAEHASRIVYLEKGRLGEREPALGSRQPGQSASPSLQQYVEGSRDVVNYE